MADETIEYELQDELSSTEEVSQVEPADPSKEEEQQARAQEMEQYSKRVQARIDELTRKYHDERRAKEELETFAKQVYEENQKLNDTLAWGRNEYIKTLNEKFEAAQKLAEYAYRQAYEAGDADGILKAQQARDEIVLQRAKYANLPPPIPDNEFKFSEPAPMPQPAQQQREEISQEPLQTEVVPDTKAQEWAERNGSWFGKDDEMTATALGVHKRLVSQGVDTQSDEYYVALDKRMAELYPEKLGKPRRSSPVAPAGRSPAAKKVMLTKEQVAFATRFNIPLDRYAKEYAKLESNSGN